MAVRLSTGLRNLAQADVGMQRALANAYIAYFVGTQPASADAAPSGQRIIEFTKAGGAYTAETLAEWKATLSGASGSVNTIKLGGASGWDLLGGAVTFTTDLTTTAALVAAQINAYLGNCDFSARSSGAIVYVKVPKGSGALMNSLTLTWGVTSLSATVAGDGTPSGSAGTAGVTAVNGCNFAAPASGVISKETSAWQGTAGTNRAGAAISGFSSGNLTAGWARIYGDGSDDDSLSTVYPRMDFSIGTANADIIANPSASIPYGSPQTISTWTITLPSGV